MDTQTTGPTVLPVLLDRDQLYIRIGRGQKPGSFANWIWRAQRDRNFPKPIVVGGRSVAWVESEVAAWLAARPRSDASRSPRPKPTAPPHETA
jgi:predicted DNA-binding transcriptional regulator AlpA